MQFNNIQEVINHYNKIYPNRFKSEGYAEGHTYYMSISDSYHNKQIVIELEYLNTDIVKYVHNRIETYLLPEFRQDKINDILK